MGGQNVKSCPRVQDPTCDPRYKKYKDSSADKSIFVETKYSKKQALLVHQLNLLDEID